MRRTAIATVLGGILLTSAAQAKVFGEGKGDVKYDVAVSQIFDACTQREVDAANREDTFPDKNKLATCYVQERTRWEKRMNAAYAALHVLLPKQDWAALQSFQRLWAADRNATCEDMDDGESGQMGAFAVLDCSLRLTASRTNDLELRVKKLQTQ